MTYTFSVASKKTGRRVEVTSNCRLPQEIKRRLRQIVTAPKRKR